MQLADWILAASVVVTDPAGHHPARPIARAGAEAIALACGSVADGKLCAAVYVVQAFRESGYRLEAVGDKGLARGPFQVHGAPMPRTWRQAVEQFTPILVRSAHTCEEPLELLATGRCGTTVGRAISRARMAEARRIVAAIPDEEP